jgi:hypothetical protein
VSIQPDQSAQLKFVVTNTLIVGDIQRSVASYPDVLGATVLREGEPTFLRLGNIWLTINGGGSPTDDKPDVIASPLRDPNVLSIFLNLRVTDIKPFATIRLIASGMVTSSKSRAVVRESWSGFTDR